MASPGARFTVTMILPSKPITTPPWSSVPTFPNEVRHFSTPSLPIANALLPILGKVAIPYIVPAASTATEAFMFSEGLSFPELYICHAHITLPPVFSADADAPNKPFFPPAQINVLFANAIPADTPPDGPPELFAFAT